jgi:hypothetical protein
VIVVELQLALDLRENHCLSLQTAARLRQIHLGLFLETAPETKNRFEGKEEALHSGSIPP